MDVFHTTVDPSALMLHAIKEATAVSCGVMDAYAHSKAMFMAPTRQRIESQASFLEESILELAMSAAPIDARNKVVEKLKK